MIILSIKFSLLIKKKKSLYDKSIVQIILFKIKQLILTIHIFVSAPPPQKKKTKTKTKTNKQMCLGML